MLVGTSSGLNLAAARRVAQERGPDSVVVTVLVDTGLKYLHRTLFDQAGAPGHMAGHLGASYVHAVGASVRQEVSTWRACGASS